MGKLSSLSLFEASASISKIPAALSLSTTLSSILPAIETAMSFLISDSRVFLTA